MAEKTKRTTDAECLETLLKREKPERVLHLETYPIAIAAIQSGKSVRDAYENPRLAFESQKRLAEEMEWLFQPTFPSLGGGWGGESRWPNDNFAQASIPVSYGIQEEQDVWNLKTPDLASLPSIRDSLEFCRISALEKIENEVFNVIFNTSGPFTMAAKICGIDKLGRWLLKKPDAAHHLLRLASDHIIQAASLWFETFSESRILFKLSEPTSSNQIISPGQFKEFAFPYIKEIHVRVLGMGYKHVFCHICGDHNANLQYWSQVPMGDPGIISIGHQIELETAAKFFSKDIIYGNIEPIILQIGTTKQIYEATKKVMIKGKQIPNGFIFGPGCELPPRAGRENILTMMKAVDAFGWYE